MKLPGLTRLKVQSLGRRDAYAVTEGAARVRAEERRGEAIERQGIERIGEYTRQARRQDLRGAGADFNVMRQELGSAQVDFQASLKIARDKVAQGAAEGQMWEGLGNMAIGAARFSQQNQLFKAERNGQEASIGMQKVYADFDKKFGGRDFIQPGELTGAADTPANRMRTNIPSAEVLPQMLEEALQEGLKTNGKLIENDYFRAKWNTDAEKTVTAVMAKANIKANAHYQNQVIKQQSTELKALMDNDQIPEAYKYIDSMLISDQEKAVARGEVKVAGEKSGYKNMIAESNEAQLKDALGELMKPFDEYREDGGLLNPDDRLSYRNAVSAELNRIDSDKRGTVSANHAILKQDIAWTQDNLLNKGQVPSPDVVEDIRQRLNLQLMMNPNSEPVRVEMRKFEVITRASGVIGNINKYPPLERQRMIDEYRSGASKQENMSERYMETRVSDHLQSAQDSMVASESQDMIQAAIDYGQDVQPINFSSAKDFQESLSQRKIDEKKMGSIYGQSQGLLTKVEARRMGEMLDNMPMSQRASFYGQVYGSLGSEESTRIWDQVRTESGATTSAIVGEIVSQTDGDLTQAVRTLEGQAYRNEPGNKNEFTQLNKLMPTNIANEIGELYPHNPSRHAGMKDAVYDTYVGLSLATGKDFLSIDDNLLKQAVDITVGSVISQGGMKMPSLTRDMDQAGFEDYIRQLPDGFFLKTGGIDNGNDGLYPEENIRKEILNGDILMRTVGSGSYMLWKNGLPMKARDGDGAFIFEYDPSVVGAGRESFYARQVNRLRNQ